MAGPRVLHPQEGRLRPRPEEILVEGEIAGHQVLPGPRAALRDLNLAPLPDDDGVAALGLGAPMNPEPVADARRQKAAEDREVGTIEKRRDQISPEAL